MKYGTMKKYFVILVILLGILETVAGIGGSVWAKSATEKTVFHIPQIDGITVDGAIEDWGDSRIFNLDPETCPDLIEEGMVKKW
jgi:hypothetical protein